MFNSQTTRASVEDLSGRTAPVHVVATPAGDRFGPGLGEDEIVQRAQREGALRVLFVGNLTARKGLTALLRALSNLPAGMAGLGTGWNTGDFDNFTVAPSNALKRTDGQ